MKPQWEGLKGWSLLVGPAVVLNGAMWQHSPSPPSSLLMVHWGAIVCNADIIHASHTHRPLSRNHKSVVRDSKGRENEGGNGHQNSLRQESPSNGNHDGGCMVH